VIADPSGLATGTYSGTVTIGSSTTGASIAIPVNLTVSALDQAIRFIAAGAVLYGGIGRRRGSSGYFAVNNIGRGTMDFTCRRERFQAGSNGCPQRQGRAP